MRICLFLEMHIKVYKGEITEKSVYVSVLVCVYRSVEGKGNVQVKFDSSD